MRGGFDVRAVSSVLEGLRKRQMAMAPTSPTPLPDEGSDGGVTVPGAPINLRLPGIISIVAGIIALMVSGVLDHLLMGALICVGLGLGLLNMWLVKGAVLRVTAQVHPSKQQMAMSSASRLLVITAFALMIGFLLRPDGIGVFVGLAISQVVLILTTTVPALKGLRQQS
jgi:hypothetical protein